MNHPINLIARRDGLLCCICGDTEPIHAGDGTPLPTLLIAYTDAQRRHPNKPHESVWQYGEILGDEEGK